MGGKGLLSDFAGGARAPLRLPPTPGGEKSRGAVGESSLVLSFKKEGLACLDLGRLRGGGGAFLLVVVQFERLEVTSAVVDGEDVHGCGFGAVDDGGAAFEAEEAQAGAEVVGGAADQGE